MDDRGIIFDSSTVKGNSVSEATSSISQLLPNKKLMKWLGTTAVTAATTFIQETTKYIINHGLKPIVESLFK